MHAWLYLYYNHFPLAFNTRRTSSKVFAPLDLTAGGFRNAQGGQDSNIDENDDDMSRLQETEATYAERSEQESDRKRPAQERDYYQEDYYANLEQEYDYGQFQYPERYSWDQYA